MFEDNVQTNSKEETVRLLEVLLNTRYGKDVEQYTIHVTMRSRQCAIPADVMAELELWTICACGKAFLTKDGRLRDGTIEGEGKEKRFVYNGEKITIGNMIDRIHKFVAENCFKTQD